MRIYELRCMNTLCKRPTSVYHSMIAGGSPIEASRADLGESGRVWESLLESLEVAGRVWGAMRAWEEPGRALAEDLRASYEHL